MVLTEAEAQHNERVEPNALNKAEKKERPASKVVIRRLPPAMSQEEFLNQVAPIPDYDYIYTIKGDSSLGENSFSRVYVNFTHQADIYVFKEKFDNYVFVDSKGHEYAAVVEYAAFQKVPKKKRARSDSKIATIESDPAYIEFIESLNEQPNQDEKPEYSYNITAMVNERKLDKTTPLLDFLKQRKVERLRLREEKRDERRKKDQERKKTREEERRKRQEDKKKSLASKETTRKESSEHEKENKDKDTNEDGASDSKASGKVVDKSAKTVKPGEKSFKTRNKYDDRKLKPKQFKDTRKEFKTRREEFKDHENVRKSEEGKADAEKPKEMYKKVKKYSEKREERKIVEASKEEAKQRASKTKNTLSEEKPEDTNVPVKSDDEDTDTRCRNKENDPRIQRRIRNKDRPTMQLYKPGMLRKKSVDNEKDGCCSEKDKFEETKSNPTED